MKKYFLLFIFLFLVGCSNEFDEYAKGYNFNYTKDIYNVELDYSNVSGNIAKGDAALINARLNNGDYEEAIKYYKKALNENEGKDKALLYETLGSITGNRFYYYKAYKEWKSIDEWRADIDWNLFRWKTYPYHWELFTIPEKYFALNKDVSTITFGGSGFEANETDILVSQVDRVTRDWLSSQLQDYDSENLLTIFSEGYDVENIGWHEGGRIKQYKEINFTHKLSYGILVKKMDGKWYAPNEDGTFMFEVQEDKILYPTTRFLTDDLALVMDTHGVNMLVYDAVKENATFVIGCCDSIGKVAAALYLNKKGIHVLCNTDKYLPLALGQAKLSYGSVPFEIKDETIIFGKHPLEISVNETIIVMNSTEDYGISYYQTPTLYFTQLKKITTLPLKLEYISVDGTGETYKLVERANELNASVIAARVYNEEDYEPLKEWLEDDMNNRLILFHSEAYPYGYKLYREFSKQVSFDDMMPQFG
jgi:tetratricopeptide (TPR) repeat protein